MGWGIDIDVRDYIGTTGNFEGIRYVHYLDCGDISTAIKIKLNEC